MIDLCEKIRLSDNEFDARLEQLGLLHGKRTCMACGGRTTINVDKNERYGKWRRTTKNCRKNNAIYVAHFLRFCCLCFTVQAI